VNLAPAGEILAREAPRALDGLGAIIRRAQRAARPEPRLAIALKADGDAGLLRGSLDAYAADGQWPPPELVLGGWGDQVQMLRDGRADVALLHAPFRSEGIESQPLLSEPRVVALASTHRLARRKRLRVVDFASEPMPRWEGEGGEEIAPLWCGLSPEMGRGARPGVTPPSSGAVPPAADLSQLLRLVELGQAVAFLPASVAARYPRSELVYRQVSDLTPLSFVVAWPAPSTSLATAAFVRAAMRVAEERATPPDGLIDATFCPASPPQAVRANAGS
jgi:DNA-binding transcriptional LysR family regulator